MKKILASIIVLAGLIMPAVSQATVTSWDFTSGILQPLHSQRTAEVKVPYLTATSTTQNNTLPKLLFTTATGTAATTTSFFSTTASSTNLFTTLFNGAGLSTCNSANQALNWAAGVFSCASISSGSVAGVATSSTETSGRIPFWTSTAGTPATLSGGVAGFTWTDALSQLTATNAVFTNSTSTNATSTNLSVSGLFNVSGNVDFDLFTSALLLTGAGGDVAEYAGTSCTNQFVRSLSALGAATCATVANTDLANSTISGISLGSNLADLTATNGTLTFSGTYNGGTARTIGLNLGNANSWTALQSFTNANSILATGSTTLQAFTFTNATGTSATTTSFYNSGTASTTDLKANTANVGTLTVGSCTGCGGTQDWVQLGQTIADGSSATMSVAISGRKTLRIVVNIEDIASASEVRLRFNSDSGGNYGSRITSGGAASVARSSASGIELLGAGGTYDYPLDVVFDVSSNSASTRKRGFWLGSSQSAASATAPDEILTGSFIWNNTSSQITSVQVVSSSGNISSGSVITVYGSKD